jgi:hypothetical protein
MSYRFSARDFLSGDILSYGYSEPRISRATDIFGLDGRGHLHVSAHWSNSSPTCSFKGNFEIFRAIRIERFNFLILLKRFFLFQE